MINPISWYRWVTTVFIFWILKENVINDKRENKRLYCFTSKNYLSRPSWKRSLENNCWISPGLGRSDSPEPGRQWWIHSQTQHCNCVTWIPSMKRQEGTLKIYSFPLATDTCIDWSRPDKTWERTDRAERKDDLSWLKKKKESLQNFSMTPNLGPGHVHQSLTRCSVRSPSVRFI